LLLQLLTEKMLLERDTAIESHNLRRFTLARFANNKHAQDANQGCLWQVLEIIKSSQHWLAATIAASATVRLRYCDYYSYRNGNAMIAPIPGLSWLIVSLCIVLLSTPLVSVRAETQEDWKRVLRNVDRELDEQRREQEQQRRNEEQQQRQQQQAEENRQRQIENEQRQLEQGADPQQIERQRQQRLEQEQRQLEQQEQQSQRQEQQKQEQQAREQKESLKKILREIDN